MRVLIAAVTLALLIPLTASAQSQAGAWSLVKTEDGRLYVIENQATRHRVSPIAATDEWLANFAEGDAWGYTLKPEAYRAPAQSVVTLDGSGTMKTRPFHLDGGNYVLRWTATPKAPSGCYHTGALRALGPTSVLESIGSTLLRDGNPASGETYAYELPAADYYLEMTSGCDWRVEISQTP